MQPRPVAPLAVRSADGPPPAHRRFAGSQWHFAEGDEVESFDNVVEVQSDKATVDISSPHDGRAGRGVDAAILTRACMTAI